MNAQLVEIVVTRDGAELARQIFPPGEYLIGSGDDCALQIDDAALAPQHVRLQVTDDGRVIIEDLGSANGSFLNEHRVAGISPWPQGMPLRLGATVFNFSITADALTMPAPARAANPAAPSLPELPTMAERPEQPTIPESLYTPPSPAPMSDMESANAAAAGGDPLRRQLRLVERQAQQLEIGREVARGGMGAVRTARESATRRTVAMKVMLHPDSVHDSARFITEARITAQLEHPNIVPIYDLGLDAEGKPFYTMKMVEGITLARVLQLLKEGVPETLARYPLGTLLTIFQKLCDALGFAHARGVIHRDLKPANIMLGKHGEVLVMDWGLAKIISAKEPTASEEANREAATALSTPPLADEDGEALNTHVGAVLGTPQYMSPEQARGENETLDARSDIFVLGLILHEILTLERAFAGRNTAQIISHVAEFDGSLPEPTVRLRHVPGGVVPESLAAVVRKATATERDRRYHTVVELQHDLEAYQNGFATSAENAGIGRQIRLLVQRHKGVFSTVAAAWLVIIALAVWFIINLHASEQKAVRAAQKALAEKEAARRAYARSQITTADEAFRRADAAAMVYALDSCPEDMRDQSWQYLSSKRDASLGDFKLAGFEAPVALTEIPSKPGQFALANDHGDIAIANVANGRTVRTIKTGRSGIHTLSISGDGRQLAVGRNMPSQIELYDLGNNGKLVKTITLPGEITHRCSLSRDGSLFAALLGNPNERTDLLLLDAHTGVVRWKKSGQFSNVILHPDGDRLLVAGNGHAHMFLLLKAQDGTEINKQLTFSFSQALSPDGKTFAVGTPTGDVVMVDSTTGMELQRGKLHNSALRELAWTPDGYLLTMGSEGKIRDGRWVFKLWNAAELTSVASFFGLKGGGAPVPWSFNADSGHLLTQENPPRLWRIPVGREAAKIDQTSDQGWSGCFLSDNVLLARKAFVLTRYDLTTPSKMTELPPTFPLNFSLAASHWPSGLFALAKNTGPEPFSIKIMALQNGAPVEKLNRPVLGRLRALDFDATAERLVAVAQGGLALVYSVKTGDLLFKVPGRFEHAVFAGGDHNFVALNARTMTGDNIENDLVLVDSVSGKTLATVTNHFRVNALAASPGRAIVATGGGDQSVHIYDAATLQERISFRAHDNEIDAIAFHPSAPIVATASADGSVKLWDYRSAKLLDYYLGLGGPPAVLAFSPNGKFLFVDGQEKTTHIYDVSHVKAP